ncbi:MAG: glycosyltransferase, partial [Clostridia bacterium]
VINPLTELYASDFDGAYYMACTHTRRLLNKINQARLGMDEEVPYINTGVMLFNLPALRENLDMERVRDYAADNKNRLMLPDQDIITALYGDKIKLLDSMIYNLSDRILALHNADPKNKWVDLEWVRKNSVIIHYFGKSKPWKPHYIGILDVFYNELIES